MAPADFRMDSSLCEALSSQICVSRGLTRVAADPQDNLKDHSLPPGVHTLVHIE